MFLDELSGHVAPGTHAILVLDGAGWHTAKDLRWPDQVTPLPLPAYSPELNPQERVWEFLRQHHLALRRFLDYTALLDACQDAWRRFIGATGSHPLPLLLSMGYRLINSWKPYDTNGPRSLTDRPFGAACDAVALMCRWRLVEGGGDDRGDHAAGAECRRPAAGGQALPGCGTQPGGCSPWRWCWKGIRAQRRRSMPVWIGRPCAIGFIVTMREGLAGLHDRSHPGPKPRLTPEQMAELESIVEQGPDPERDGIVRWRRVDLQALIKAPLRRQPA